MLVACGDPVAVPGVATTPMTDGTEDPLATPIADLPAFALRTQADQPFGREQFLGKVTVVNFIFTTCPDICPMLSAEMSEITGHYTNEPGVQFVSISVDPATDTPAVLATYAGRFGADPARWRFLTGARDSISAIARDGFQVGELDTSRTHSTRVMLVDGQGRVRGHYPVNEKEELDALLRGISQLYEEGS